MAQSSVRARQLARELLVKALYQWQIAGHDVAELTAQFAALAEFARCDQDFFREQMRAAINDATALDALIDRQAKRGIEQIDAVGHAVLLLGLAELKYRADIPTRVVINEYVELAKRYGAAESFKFVNAVLDKMSRELRRESAPVAK